MNPELLRQEKLTGMIQEFLPSQPIFKSMLPIETDLGDTVTWDIEKEERKLTGFQGDGSPAQPLALSGIGQKTAKLGKIFISETLKGGILNQLRKLGSEQDDLAAKGRVLAAEKSLAGYIDRTEEFLAASALQGSITTTVDGLAVDAIDYGIPTGTNVFTYNNGTAAINCGDWADPSTNILEALEKMVSAAEDVSGYTVKNAFVSGTVMQYLLNNEKVIELLRGTSEGVGMLEQNRITKIGDLILRRANRKYRNASGVLTRYLPEKVVVLCPEPSTDWGSMRYGSDLVPNDAGDGFKDQMGRYSYSEIKKNPVGVTLYGGVRLLPVIKKAGALIKATVAA